jgi:hypothetical protein
MALVSTFFSNFYTLPAEMFGGVIFGWKPELSSKFRPILDTQETLTNFHGDEAKNPKWPT